ncbi:MAG: SDR family NAD(P)-dependent oxidoreductase, partial [Chloroflexota bacterium]|nr:SDR family NAD(P)-dependent oxidoreductase [Chloroflexota bacterium]
MFRLDGRATLVTGAGSGIGREIALLYAKQGALVALGDIDEAAAERVAGDITGAGGQAFPQRLDVTDLDSSRAAVAAVVERHGRLDVLVNNAGIGLVGSVTETEPADFDRLMAVNVRGVYHCT